MANLFVERIELMDELKKLLMQNEGSSTICIQGVGGAGKTSLAEWVEICLDFRNYFTGKIFWIKLGQKYSIEEKLKASIKMFGWTETFPAEIRELSNILRDQLNKNRCLIILDDLWCWEDLELFLPYPGSRSRILVTSRQIERNFDGPVIKVDKMKKEEALALLVQGVNLTLSQNEEESLTQLAINEFMLWPFLLNIGLGTLRSYLRGGSSLTNAIDAIKQAFSDDGIVALNEDDSIRKELSITTCLSRSIDGYSDDQQERIRALGIFVVGSEIPLTLIRKWWKNKYGLNVFTTDAFCRQLNEIAILDKLELDRGFFIIHDVIHKWLGDQFGKSYPEFHASMLTSQMLSRAATELPENEPYLWRHLFHHMEKAGENWLSRMTETARDLLFYAKKSKLIHPADCIADLKKMVLSDPLLIPLMHRMNSLTHLLEECDNIKDAAQCLYARLYHEPDMQAILPSLNIHQFGPYLEPIHPLLDQPSLERKRDEIWHTHKISSVRINQAGDKLVTGADDSTVKVWDISSEGKLKLLRTFRGHRGGVLGVAISPNSKFVASAGSDHALFLWDMETGHLLNRLMGHTGTVSWCDFHPTEDLLISSSYDNTVILWETKTGRIIHHLKGHELEILDCAFSPDGKYIASTSEDKKVILWETETGANVHEYESHKLAVGEVCFSDDLRYIASVGFDSLVLRYTRNHKIMFRKKKPENYFNCCVFGVNSKIIITGMGDGSIIIWACPSGKEIRTLSAHKEAVVHCAVHPNGQWMVSVSGDRSIILWDIATGSQIDVIDAEWEGYFGVAFSPNQHQLAIGSHKNGMTLWDWQTGCLERGFMVERTNDNKFNSAWEGRFSPDGQKLAVIFMEILCLWDIEKWELLWSKPFESGEETYCLDMSCNGDLLLVGTSENILYIIDIEGNNVKTLQGHDDYVFDCCFHPADSNIVLSASTDATLHLWDVENGKELQIMRGHTEDVWGCAFHPDGKKCYSVGQDRTLREWDLETGKELKCYSGHKSLISSLAIHPEKKWLATASEDRTLKIWDLDAGKCLMTFHANDHLNNCAFHPSESAIVVTGGSGVYFLRWVE